MASNFIVGIGGSDLDDLFEALNGNSKIDDVGFSDSNGDLSNKYLGLASIQNAIAYNTPTKYIKVSNQLNSYFQKRNAWTVGDIGPSGGYIFYDKGYYSTSIGLASISSIPWRYIEAQKQDYSLVMPWQDNGYAESNIGTSPYISPGEGSYSSYLINYYMGQHSACGICLSYGSDWYLPNPIELMAMYTNLYSQGKGYFHANTYWSSIEYDAHSSYKVNFFNGSTPYNYKTNTGSVRACRRF